MRMNHVTIKKTKQYLIVKIPLQAVKTGNAEVSTRTQKIIEQAIMEGMRDIEEGRTFGPFSTIKAFKRALTETRQK